MNDWPFASLRQVIDEALERYLAPQAEVPERLRQAMHYSLLGPGKRLRPILVLLSAQACGGDYRNALPAACAVEMVHAYSLIHDDLPAMDDDDLRRGRPTCHRQFDEATAILAGDALLTLAFEVLSELEPGALAQDGCRTLARAAGMAGMVGGQMDDLLAERHELPADSQLLHRIHLRKTAALFRAAAHLGGLIATWHRDAEFREAALRALDAYAISLGLAFQIADDLLDVEGQEGHVGKRVGKDARRGKLTFPGLLGVPAAREKMFAAQEQALAALQFFGPAADPLRQLAEFVVRRKA
ncbi:MAG: polyprenyl synthetase family protein [Gemmatales bacterium]|nr:polyprenyl synthetase family protein [Gemmatales bacterium]MDW7995961.1 polyprenyl synthetase family protein [Gemmatales bacterium]